MTPRIKAVFLVAVATCVLSISPIGSNAASVTDGDGLVIDGQRIRIHGIDAPERNQPGGDRAIYAMEQIVWGQSVVCEKQDIDRYGRTVAKCFVGSMDIGERMVRDGLARAYLRYSRDYEDAEQQAKADGFGMWSDPEAIAPWDWRLGKR